MSRIIYGLFILCLLSGAVFGQNPIVLENQQAGTSAWQLYQANFLVADDVAKQIKGYASAASINRGSAITFYATVSPAQSYTIDIYRVGWYQGLGGRLMQHIGPIAGTQQPACPTTATTGMIACAWSAGSTFTVPSTWTSGVYLALLTNAQNYQNYIPFVVRDDASHSALLYQEGANSFQAFNNYPDDNLTGKSLYDFNSFGAATVTGGPGAVKVSLDRPYADDGQGGFLSWEIYALQWLEQNGYDVSYTTDVDVHANGALLLNHKGFLTVGDDEYWSKPQRTAVETARDAGVNLAFLGSAISAWQVRMEPSPTTAVVNRVLVCYRTQSLDPIQGPTTTIQWRDSFLNLPEQMMIGVMYTAQNVAGYNDPPGSYVVANNGNWVYAGTGLANGASIPLVLGYQIDRYDSTFSGPLANAGTFTLLSNSPAIDANNGNAATGNSSVYQAASGAWVFATGTTDWAWGLSRTGFISTSLQQITSNVLNRFVAGSSPPTISSRGPAAGATGVATSTTVSATFSRAMQASTFTASTFTLKAAGASSNVTATVGVSGATATLTPLAALTAGTVYTATIAAAVTDTNGVALGTAATWTFTTAAAVTPPAITSQTPAAGAANVAANTTVSATFNRAMLASTFTTSTFTLQAAGSSTNVPATIGVSGATATLTPLAALTAGTVYTATIAATVTDTNGVALGTAATWSFTTATAAPAIISQTPTAGATNVATNTTVTATFSRAMLGSTFTTATFTLKAAGASSNVTATVAVSGATATLTPSAALTAGTVYTATIAATVTDTNAIALGTAATWSFTTAAATPPTIISQTPASGASGVVTSTTVSATFSRAMLASTFTTSTFTLKAAGASSNVTATVAVSGATATLTPSTALTAGTVYTATIAATVTDTNSIALGTAASWSFTTAAVVTPPTIVSQSPTSGSTGVATNTTVSVTFSRAMLASTFTSTAFTLTAAGASNPVAATIAISGATATLTPSAALNAGTSYTAQVAATVTDSGGVALGSAAAWAFTTAATTSNPIVLENQQPGTNQWQLYTTSFLVADDVAKQMKGYASTTSVNKGGSIAFYATVAPAQNYTIDIYRIGYYQGLGGRLMQHIGPILGKKQAACPTNASTGMIACNWPAASTITIPTTWTTGVYLAMLTNAAGYQNYINFVVRDDSSHSAFLYQESVNTGQAYNNYPDDGSTGKSLYDFNSNGANTVVGSKRAAKVSFDRPYADAGVGDFLSWEVYTVQWLEQNGYDVSYSTDVDSHANGALLLNHKGLLAVGHSEYWSKPMRTAAETARDSGVNLAFISADSVGWQVRFEASPTTGVANRVMVCYKSATADPVQGPTTTVEWKDAPVNLPEQTLVGVMFAAQNIANYGDPPATLVVTNGNNWVYAGTGLTTGSTVPLVVGYEVDQYYSAFPAPVAIPGTYTLLSNSPTVDVYNGNTATFGNSSVYQAPSGAWVFASGTMDWGWGLSNPGFVDSRIQLVTKNILDRFASSVPAPIVLSRTPASGATSVARTTNVTLSFNRAMQAASFTPTTFTLTTTAAGTNVTATVSASGATATLTPSATLAAQTTYTATVAGTVTDSNGVPLGTAVTWTFTTGP